MFCSTIIKEVISLNYTPLYLQTDATILTSEIQVLSLITYAKEHKIPALALTDENLYNAIEFYEICNQNHIKPIIGLELQIGDGTLILYARNYIGYQNLLYLSTLKSERKIEIEDLKHHNRGLLAIIPYSFCYLQEPLSYLYEYVFIGYKNEEERAHIISNGIYIQKTLCLNKEDTIYLSYLKAIREGKLIFEMEEDMSEYYLHLDKTLFSENNYKIYDLCNLVIQKEKNLLPIYPCEGDAYLYLKNLCIEGMRHIFGNTVRKVYIDRLKYELEVIHKMDFCNYFLIVWDYVRWAKENDILVGPGRGSAAGSLVAYFLNITTIDPIKYNLLFERFLNPERITMPDIDIDFEDVKREKIIQYCISKYGSKKVASIITFGTLKSKQVIRDVARSMDLDLKTVDMICHLLDAKFTLLENYKRSEQLKKIILEDINLKKMYKVASKLEGLKRHTSIHAAGIVMSYKDLDTVIPLDKSHDHSYKTGYSMEYLENLGLLKMDFLALTALTTIHEMIGDINKNEHVNLSFDMIPENDTKALKIFEMVNTVGIFQFESEGMKSFLRKFRPSTFEEIVAVIALYRPASMENIDLYIRRKRGLEKVSYIHDDLISILKPTYGIIIYQEQVMQIASVMAGYSYAEADLLRRAMSKKKEEILIKEKDRFLQKSVERGYSLNIASEVYDLILKFASYGFNRAHSVAYSMISYKFAYLKAYYPAYFMKNLLNSMIGNENKTKEYLYECRENQLKILPPDIQKSGKDYIIENGMIRIPLLVIKNVGLQSCSLILEEREKESFLDLFDFMARCYSKSVSKKVLESLIYAGVLVCFGYNRKTLIHNLDALMNYAEIAKDLSYELTLKPEIVIYDEFSKKEIMQKEIDLFGFYISDHPITKYNMMYKEKICLSNISNYFDKVIGIIVYVDRIHEVKTKNNDLMCFITGSDEITKVDIVMFPIVYRKYNEIKIGNILYIVGKVEKRFDKYQVIVKTLKILEC